MEWLPYVKQWWLFEVKSFLNQIIKLCKMLEIPSINNTISHKKKRLCSDIQTRKKSSFRFEFQCSNLNLKLGKFEFQNWNWTMKISSFRLELDTRFCIFLDAFPHFDEKVDSSSTLFYDFFQVCMSGCAKDYLIVQNI